MSEQYLILHKVRGEPSFDCATKMHCPLCTAETSPCADCSCDEGYWWITNSGHRAYPYWHQLLAQFGCNESSVEDEKIVRVYSEPYEIEVEPPPADWPDHFEVRNEGPKQKLDVTALFARLMPKLKRRI